ncbi:hypothetical protein YT1_1080 [Rhodococcus ruber]|nr:hypothetical protein YT1_1080 [Rhodococcus ruber]
MAGRAGTDPTVECASQFAHDGVGVGPARLCRGRSTAAS